MEYTIGLIDEEKAHLSAIRRTFLLSEFPEGDTISFKEYLLEGGRETLSQSIISEVITDIIAGNIQTLIIDYKMMIQSALLEGTNIYRDILDIVPKFPVVILTDVPDSCYEKPFVDADKVYWKREFFKLADNYSKEKVLNIYRNMTSYVKRRAELTTRIDEKIAKLESDGFTPEIYKDLLEAERALDELYPQGQTEIDKMLNPDDLKDVIALLEQAEKLTGGTNEAT